MKLQLTKEQLNRILTMTNMEELYQKTGDKIVRITKINHTDGPVFTFQIYTEVLL